MADEQAVETEVNEENPKLDLKVDISDIGPCQKHVKVTIPQAEINKQFHKEFSELVRGAAVPGFRPGKAPRRLIERRFKEDVSGTVKSNVLMRSLEQIGEDYKLDPLSEPKLDVQKILLPDEGDFTYEFDIEVRPQFDLPNYKGLSLKKPAKEFSDKDIDAEVQLLLRRSGEMKPKTTGAAEGDYVVADVRFENAGEAIQTFDDLRVRVDKELIFRDGTIADFLQGIQGAKEGDTRGFKVKIAETAGKPDLAGKEVDATFVVKQVEELEPAQLNDKLFSQFHVSDEGELRDLVKGSLERRLELAQRQALTEQVMLKLTEKADWDLPPDLVKRQTERNLQRRLFDLQNAGYPEEEIRARVNRIRHESLSATRKSLKEQFVLQAIAEAEDFKVEESDLEAEIEAMAARLGESPRKLRARVEKEQLWDAIGLQVLERKTIDRIIESAKVDEVPWKPESETASSVDESAIPVEPEPVSEESESAAS